MRRVYRSVCLLFAIGLSALLAGTHAANGQPAGEVDSTLNIIEASFKNSDFLKTHPGFKMIRKDNSIVVEYHQKTWLVYGCGMDGTWSKEPRRQVGPDSDGIIITVSVIDIKNAGQEQSAFRTAGLDLQGLAGHDATGENIHILRQPYWSIYGCGQDMEKRKVRVSCNVEFNNRTDHKLLQQAFAPVPKAFQLDNQRQNRGGRD